MNTREELHEALVGACGSRNVYFQPPASIKMKYPCIVYCLDSIPIKYAGDKIYKYNNKYMVTVIDKDPESQIVTNLLTLPTFTFNRHYVADNLYHYVFTVWV